MNKKTPKRITPHTTGKNPEEWIEMREPTVEGGGEPQKESK
jgi:hypothetical protein